MKLDGGPDLACSLGLSLLTHVTCCVLCFVCSLVPPSLPPTALGWCLLSKSIAQALLLRTSPFLYFCFLHLLLICFCCLLYIFFIFLSYHFALPIITFVWVSDTIYDELLWSFEALGDSFLLWRRSTNKTALIVPGHCSAVGGWDD